jgi:RNA polymerase sigma factor (sigma-70 family)
MAHNAALNWKKQRNKTVLKSPAVFERIAAVDAKTDRYDIVNKAIASLPPNLALVIHMYYYDKLTYLEMSIQTGKSVKAIDSMLNRARIKLRKKIKMDEDGAFKLID